MKTQRPLAQVSTAPRQQQNSDWTLNKAAIVTGVAGLATGLGVAFKERSNAESLATSIKKIKSANTENTKVLLANTTKMIALEGALNLKNLSDTVMNIDFLETTTNVEFDKNTARSFNSMPARIEDLIKVFKSYEETIEEDFRPFVERIKTKNNNLVDLASYNDFKISIALTKEYLEIVLDRSKIESIIGNKKIATTLLDYRKEILACGYKAANIFRSII